MAVSKPIAELLVETAARLLTIPGLGQTKYTQAVRSAAEIVAAVYGPPCGDYLPPSTGRWSGAASWGDPHERKRHADCRPGDACDRCGWPKSSHAA